MTRLFLLMLLLAAAAPSFAEETDTANAPVRLQFDMHVDAHGVPTSLAPYGDMPASISETIEQWAIAHLRFEPATVGGVPKPTHTTLFLKLAPMPGGGYGFESAGAGPRLVRGRYGYYPRHNGAGYFIIAYDEEGKVTRVEFDEESTPRRATGIGGGEFVRWGMALARSFRLAPEVVDGHPVAGEIRVPLVFCWEGTQCHRLPPMKPDLGTNLDGEMVAKSVLTLETEVAGQRI